MSPLKRLDSRFSVRAAEPAATVDEIEQLCAFAAALRRALPGDDLDVLRAATDVEILVEQRGCIRLWSPEGVLEMNAAHDVQRYIPGGLAIGDDEGGMAFVLMTGREGPGLYRLSFSDPDPDEAVFIASSLAALLERGVGIDRLFAWDERS